MNSGLFPVDSKGCEFPAIAGSGFQLSTEAYHFPVRPSFTSILTHSSDLLFNQLMSSSRLMLILLSQNLVHWDGGLSRITVYEFHLIRHNLVLIFLPSVVS